ncbi:ankyrin repeat-containing domain protein [Mycena vulgaris]|nr:ankyrin repeat-containing domain protein [Mycena vulgaris]
MNPMNPPPTFAVAFFYFDFKDKEGQAVEKRLKTSIGCRADRHYQPIKICKASLKSYSWSLDERILFYALDECKEADLEQLLRFISTLRSWTRTPLHLLITSQPRSSFTKNFKDVPCIELQYEITQRDIKSFVAAELRKPSLKIWTSRADYITDRVVHKSSGMFRLAACLLIELSRRWQDEKELDNILDNLPNDLFGIYNRFLEAIHPDDFVYVEGVLRWLIFSARSVTLEQLADAVAFDFTDPAGFIYVPGRREGNEVAILRWLEGLVTVNQSSEVVLAHASVQDYILSRQFSVKFSRDISVGLSHTFIAQTCIGYMLHFSNNDEGNPGTTYPLALYASKLWCYHLLLCHDRNILFPGTMRLLESGSAQYTALLQHNNRWGSGISQTRPPGSLLHLCCWEGYMEGADKLLANGADINLEDENGTPLQVAAQQGKLEMVRLLLKSGANADAKGGKLGGVLQVASVEGYTGIVRLLLDHGADGNSEDARFGTALTAASSYGHKEMVALLIQKGVDVNAKNGSALQTAVRWGYLEIVRILLKNGASANVTGGRYGSALNAAAAEGHTAIVRLLLESGAQVNTTHGNSGTALHASSAAGHTDIARLLLENGADVNAPGGRYGSAVQAASAGLGGHVDLVRLLVENGAHVNTKGGLHGTALQAASTLGRREIVDMLLQNGAVAVAEPERRYQVDTS